MSAAAFLGELETLDIRLWTEDGRLRFDAPAGALTAEIRAELGARKAEIMELLAQRAEQTGQRLIRPVGRDRDLPLSFAQQRLWFLAQLAGASTQYNIVRAVSLRGRLDQSALARTVSGIVERHEALRTTFSNVGGQPCQRIAETFEVELPVEDLTETRAGEREARVKELAAAEYARPFDLRRGPLFRAKLLRLGDDEHVFVVAMHHIVSDGWSMAVLFRELGALYGAYSAGRPPPLAPLPIQYADFAVWQRQWLSDGVLAGQLDYWRGCLAGLPVLQLPTDRRRPSVQTFAGARQAMALPGNLRDGLASLSRAEGATLFMTMLAVFAVLLHRYSGQDDIVVGSPIANRKRSETEGLIGFFVNSLVMRVDVSGDPNFRALLGRVREVALGAYEHQDLPFEKLVEELDPVRDMSRNPLFQVMFAVQNAPTAVLELADLQPDMVPLTARTTRFDLEVQAWEGPSGVEVQFIYNTDLFDGGTIERMVDHYRRLLESVVADPGQRISRLDLLGADERRRILVEWNDTATDYERGFCVHQLFEQQARRAPNAVAVVHEGAQLTYGQLNERSNRLAHYLRASGVGPEVLVGICLERNLDLIVALLGILKAGGAYVPLDPGYPQERLAFMVEDSAATVVVTQTSLEAALPAGRVPVVCLDTLDWGGRNEPGVNSAKDVTAENLAYVIYTSGSTGKPKGVAIEHRNAAALIEWAGRTFRAEQLTGVLASTSICFDMSVFEIFCPLALGGKLILVADALSLIGGSADTDVRLINTVPSVISQLARAGDIPSSVETICLAGEPLSGALVRDLYASGLVKYVYDLYGPSEDTTYSTEALRRADGPDTIGRPIANTQAHVLDAHLQPVPIGVRGELFLAGEGVARGYLHRPELTAEKFVPDPFSDEPGRRMYRTGDLARYFPDGNLEFLGRLDNQVKLRGYRIELGEIEAVLAEHPAVREAVVTLHDNGRDKHLVAYVVADEHFAVADRDVREFVKRRLPEYMVPFMVVVLDAMPLTPNGKVDRAALAPPDIARPGSRGGDAAPRTAVERALVGVWTEVLGLDHVGIHDNFFDLGGHSLLATQVVSRMRDTFDMGLPLAELFAHPSIAELAECVENARWVRDSHAAKCLGDYQEGEL